MNLSRSTRPRPARPSACGSKALCANPSNPAIRWIKGVMTHAALQFAAASADDFGSRDHAARLQDIAELSDAALADLFEAARARKRSTASVKNLYRKG